jgi:hypothetical protein
MIVEGLGDKQIANNLDISLRTFLTRRTGLLQKLDASSRAELIRKAVLHGKLVPQLRISVCYLTLMLRLPTSPRILAPQYSRWSDTMVE